MIEVKDKRVAVIGLSKRTGVAAAKMLAKHGARVIVSDIKGSKQLTEEIKMLQGIEVEYDLNGHGEKSLTSDLIVVSPGVPLTIPFFRKAKERNIPIISEIELAFHYTNAGIIAITGTNGKTTTTRLIGDILKKAFPEQVKVAGNIGTPLIQEAVNLAENNWLVTEVSSFQLETIEDFRAKISLFLNFSPDHLDRHQTIENYWEAKKRIFKNQQPADIAIINDDDELVVKAVADCKAKIYHVSLIKEVERGVYLQGSELILKDKNKVLKMIDVNKIPLKGKHNWQNVAFAGLAAYLAGAEIEEIKSGIINFVPDKHRLETIAEFEKNIIVDDSKATNPDAAIKALQTFSQPVILIAGGQDRNADFSSFAEMIKQKVKTLILLGETSSIIKDEVLKKGFSNINIKIVENMSEAVRMAFQYLKIGDCLLLSPGCPSWDMYDSYKERGNHFKTEVESVRGN